MTIEERFERIEHLTAGLAEERRKDREEYKALWRETQRKIDELGAKTLQFAAESREEHERLRAEDKRLKELIEQYAEESRAADQRLGARIESLVSSMGELITKLIQQPPNRP